MGELLSRLPRRFNRYYEPFLGGGALFFAVAAQRPQMLSEKGRFVLGDANPHLMLCYRTIRDRVQEVMESLLRFENASDAYYAAREQFNNGALAPVERSALLIYLNHTCYNGLWRVNRQGAFNVPFGRYRRPTICDAANLGAVSRTLRDVELVSDDFENVLRTARVGDLAYLDPPYHPVSATSSFTSYHKDNFAQVEQVRLLQVFQQLDARGVQVMLSNSWCSFTRQAYQSWHVEAVYATRAINSRGDRRGRVKELIVRNYET